MNKENIDILQPSELENLFELRKNEDEQVREKNSQTRADKRAFLQQMNNALEELYSINSAVFEHNSIPKSFKYEDIGTQMFDDALDIVDSFRRTLGVALTKALRDRDVDKIKDLVHIFPELSQLNDTSHMEKKIELSENVTEVDVDLLNIPDFGGE